MNISVRPPTTAFYFDPAEMSARAPALREAYMAGEPFPHVAIPDLLPAEIHQALAREFPKVGDMPWTFAGPGDTKHTNDPNVEKVSQSNEALWPSLTRHVLQQFNSSVFLDFLHQVTGLRDLIVDPHFGGGGLHSTGPGGRLMVHADADRHPSGALYQQLNVIYMVNDRWDDAWGGGLELWDKELRECVKTVPARPNQAVLFYTGSKCYHGHPHPLACPAGVRRNTFAIYYYTVQKRADYDGHTRFVTWIETTDQESKLRLRTRIRRVAEKVLPRRVMRTAIGAIRGWKGA